MPATDTDDLDLLRKVGQEAGRIAMRYFKASPEVWMKTGQSPVSEADYAVDKYLRETLLDARPDYGWLSEETADTPERLGKLRTFVVDPIDGTRGFLEGRDVWCVSIAVVEGGRPTAGVLDCPARNEVFWATRGAGSFRNDVRLRVRAAGLAPEVGGPKPMVDALPQRLRDTLKRIHYIPSLAYRIAMIADSALDATFVRAHSHDWDLAAADLILHEAGGAICNRDRVAPTYGGEITTHGALAASGPDMIEMMTAVIAGNAFAPAPAVSNRLDLL